MTRNEFEEKYLNKKVAVKLYYEKGEFKGCLFSTNELREKPHVIEKKNYYFVGNSIWDHTLRFRKSHIKSIKLIRG